MSKRLPAEWERQGGVMLTWPHPDTDWSPILDQVEKVFTEISHHISRFEKLLVVCHSDTHQAHVKQLLIDANINMKQVQLALCQSNDTWARDHGPITIFENEQAKIIDFQFNGWGNKFAAPLDNQITACLYEQDIFHHAELESTGFVLEGGSIESDGNGTLLTTSACLLSPQRNPGMSRQQIEQYLKNTLGFERILWLEHGGLEGDDTDSHIDTLARFCDPQTIIYQACDDPADSHYLPLQAMAKELAGLQRPDGQPYQLVALPFPAAIHDDSGQRLPASYANFLIINHAVLFPVYQDKADEQAIEIVRQVFPEREIIPINARPLIQQYGSIHCLTMQLPEGIL